VPKANLPCRGALVDASEMIESASLSPSGARALFSAAVSLSVPAEKGDGAQFDEKLRTAERTPVWSPDGKQVAWFSDASGEYRLMIGTQEGLSARADQFDEPDLLSYGRLVRDGKYIAVTGRR